MLTINDQNAFMLGSSMSPSHVVAQLDNDVNGAEAESVHYATGSQSTLYLDSKSNKDNDSFKITTVGRTVSGASN